MQRRARVRAASRRGVATLIWKVTHLRPSRNTLIFTVQKFPLPETQCPCTSPRTHTLTPFFCVSPEAQFCSTFLHVRNGTWRNYVLLLLGGVGLRSKIDCSSRRRWKTWLREFNQRLCLKLRLDREHAAIKAAGPRETGQRLAAGAFGTLEEHDSDVPIGRCVRSAIRTPLGSKGACGQQGCPLGSSPSRRACR
jgi:hypothetical protein